MSIFNKTENKKLDEIEKKLDTLIAMQKAYKIKQASTTKGA